MHIYGMVGRLICAIFNVAYTYFEAGKNGHCGLCIDGAIVIPLTMGTNPLLTQGHENSIALGNLGFECILGTLIN